MRKFDRKSACSDKIEDLWLPVHDRLDEADQIDPLPHPAGIAKQIQGGSLSSMHYPGRIKWVLQDKKKLKKVVDGVREMNETLLQVVVLSGIAKLVERTIDNTSIINSKDAKITGLSGRLRRRQLIAESTPDQLDYKLPNLKFRGEVTTLSLQKRTSEICHAKNKYSTQDMLVEYKEYPQMVHGMDDTETAKAWDKITSRVQQLAGLLKLSGDAELGTLPFLGVIEEPDSYRHAFVFAFPDLAKSYVPVTLYDIIGYSRTIPNLESRFKLAERISASLASFHDDKWIHKNIQSRSIVFLMQEGSEKLSLDDPYLVNFEYSRPETASTLLLVNKNDEESVYRHPEIQDANRSANFTRLHDIYALGIILLEIALWQPAHRMRERAEKQESGLDADSLREFFIRRAQRKVASTMGTPYQNAIEWCLGSNFRNQIDDSGFSESFHKEVTANVSASAVA